MDNLSDEELVDLALAEREKSVVKVKKKPTKYDKEMQKLLEKAQQVEREKKNDE
jgi:hypothetical protein